MEYDQYRRSAAEDLFQSLPAEEQALIEALARSNSKPDGIGADYMAPTLIRLEKARLTTERHADKISDFDHWSASRAA